MKSQHAITTDVGDTFMKEDPKISIGVVDLLPVLDKMLIDLLQSLTEDDWRRQTIAKEWTVKDVGAHLLDGNIRLLSILRDKHWGEKAAINSYEDLVVFLNKLNGRSGY